MKCRPFYWNVFRFKTNAPRGFWLSIENQRNFLDKIAQKYNVTNEIDWQKVTTTQITDNGGITMLKQYPSFFVALKTSNYKLKIIFTK